MESRAEKGFDGDQLRDMGRITDAEQSDLYDVLAYIAFAAPPITRQARAEACRPAIASQYGAKLQRFLDFVLAQYVREGVGELDGDKLPRLLTLRYHAIGDAVAELGLIPDIRAAFVGFQAHLYAP